MTQQVELTHSGGWKFLLDLRWNSYITNALLAAILLVLILKH
jgi:hypothetical protein